MLVSPLAMVGGLVGVKRKVCSAAGTPARASLTAAVARGARETDLEVGWQCADTRGGERVANQRRKCCVEGGARTDAAAQKGLQLFGGLLLVGEERQPGHGEAAEAEPWGDLLVHGLESGVAVPRGVQTNGAEEMVRMRRHLRAT